jgi:hypothetical protein
MRRAGFTSPALRLFYDESSPAAGCAAEGARIVRMMQNDDIIRRKTGGERKQSVTPYSERSGRGPASVIKTIVAHRKTGGVKS